MKKSKFTETQIVSILKQADASVPVKEADSTTKCTTFEGDIENVLWRTEV